MTRLLRGKEVGMDCDFEVHAETEEEILKKAAEHAKTKHNMKEVPEEIVEKVRRVLREEQRR